MRSLLAFALGLFCLTGCATRALWDNGNLLRFREPAKPANLELLKGRQEKKALVVYTEMRDTDEQKKRRAYWVNAEEEPPSNPMKPSFVSVEKAKGLTPILRDVTPDVTGLSGILSTNGQGFVLFFDGRKLWDFELPVYEDASGDAKKVALTPLAVLLDLTVVGGVLFLWAHGWGLFTN